MKIYTKQGDKGKTKLISGKIVSKNDSVIEALGSIDELDAVLGLARAAGLSKNTDKILKKTQINLFEICSMLAAGGQAGSGLLADGVKPRCNHAALRGGLNKKFIQNMRSQTEVLEKEIDKICTSLPKTKHFVMFGDSKKASLINFGRVVCRRAERRVTALESADAEIIIPYLNRLSDFLFVLARLCHCERL